MQNLINDDLIKVYLFPPVKNIMDEMVSDKYKNKEVANFKKYLIRYQDRASYVFTFSFTAGLMHTFFFLYRRFYKLATILLVFEIISFYLDNFIFIFLIMIFAGVTANYFECQRYLKLSKESESFSKDRQIEYINNMVHASRPELMAVYIGLYFFVVASDISTNILNLF